LNVSLVADTAPLLGLTSIRREKMSEEKIRNISDVPELVQAGYLENKVEPIEVAEDKYITIYDVAEVEGRFGLYVVMEVQINGGHGRTRLRSGAQAVVRKMQIARELGLFPIRGKVVRIGRTWDIV
jgi:hypothetical protein